MGLAGASFAGPIDFATVGVLASLVGPIAEAGVSDFAVSTFDTGYWFVRTLTQEWLPTHSGGLSTRSSGKAPADSVWISRAAPSRGKVQGSSMWNGSSGDVTNLGFSSPTAGQN